MHIPIVGVCASEVGLSPDAQSRLEMLGKAQVT